MRQNIHFVVQSVCDAPMINTSYQKLPFGGGDYPDKLLVLKRNMSRGTSLSDELET